MSGTDDADSPLRELRWDGQTLRAEVSVDTPLQLYVDGQLFARWPAHPAGLHCQHFAFAPGGQDALQLQICRAGVGVHAPVQVHWGEPGQVVARTAPAPLRQLLAEDHAWRVDAATVARMGDVSITVIVPIYNAAESFARCLVALRRYTSAATSLLLIDDASSDAGIAPLLARAATWPNVRVLRNERNLGFTATVNRGLRQATGDVVLLNADAEVGPGWLGALRAAAYANADVASATAVSNNAGAFSVPELEQSNALPSGWDHDDAARALRQMSGLIQPVLPTGNGFCMFMRAAARAQVGELDEQAFAQGYGEENDWCQRAAALGWRHVIAGNVYVGHARSQSFGDARRATLGAQGMAVLRQRYPRYEEDVAAQLFSYERLTLDWRVRRVWAAATDRALPEPRALLMGVSDGAWPGWSAWRVREARDRVECIDADGLLRESASTEAGDATLLAWLQRYGIEAVLCAPSCLPRLAPVCAALGVACVDGSRVGMAPNGHRQQL